MKKQCLGLLLNILLVSMAGSGSAWAISTPLSAVLLTNPGPFIAGDTLNISTNINNTGADVVVNASLEVTLPDGSIRPLNSWPVVTIAAGLNNKVYPLNKHTFDGTEPGGIYKLRLTIKKYSDNSILSEDEKKIAFSLTDAVDVGIDVASDDAEEYWNCEDFNNCYGHPNGLIKLNSIDLDMGHEQMKYVGLRFQNMNIPSGAVITNAYLEFTGDEANSGEITLRIRCEGADNAAPFTTSPFNIGNRSKTSAETLWTPGAWVVGQTYQSDNFAASVQEVIDRGGWNSGNALAVLITRSVGDDSGDDVRAAVSYDTNPNAAPILYVEYTTP